MMNKKGFTLTEVLASIVILGIILGIAIPSVNIIMNKGQEEIYYNYERMMEEYAKVSEIKRDTIYLNELEGLDEIKNSWTGYVKVTNKENYNEYKAFIKCGDKYKTEGYA